MDIDGRSFERFFNNIEFFDKDKCWEWTASKDKNGYGKFYANGKHIRAHRYSYMAAIGPIGDGLFVCHSCDNPSCVNPDHLFIGTPLDNMRDKVSKGRLRNQNMDKKNCKRGHPFSGENLVKLPFTKGKRICRICYEAYYKKRNLLISLGIKKIKN